MPYYINNNYYHHRGHHSYGSSNHELAERFAHETRYSHRPTQYIVNNGHLVVDDRSARHSDAVIYNARGSTMWLKPTSNDYSPIIYEPHYSYRSRSSCRGCYERRGTYSAGYCRDCYNHRYYDTDRKVISISTRRLLT